MKPLNAHFVFDLEFFGEKISILEKVKRFLITYPNVEIITLYDFWKFRKFVMEWHVPPEMEFKVDISSKQLFESLGGVRILEKLAFYDLSPPAVAVAFVYLYCKINGMADWVTPSTENMTEYMGKELLSILLGPQAAKNNILLVIFLTWVRQESEDVDAALRLVELELRYDNYHQRMNKMKRCLQRYLLCVSI